jgi:hypothetical protein
MSRSIASRLGILLAATAMLAADASAQSCKVEDVHAEIERTGQRLRDMSTEWQPRLTARLRELAERRGWSVAETDARGRTVIEDAETSAMDARAADLLSALDRLADADQSGPSMCERLEQARTTASQLIEITAQRNAHAMARIDVALRPPVPPPQASPAPPAPPRQAAAPSPRPPSQPQPAPPTTSSWDARTETAPAPPPAVQTPPSDPSALGFSPEEIRAAGRGFFGTISAGLASVIDLAFQRYGRPTGYVLGDEGGGAFLAGLRYGEGRLVTKLQGERKVYWQGPSAGFDFGLAGSRVMFLVYNVEDQEELFQRFSGIDGSAYLVGGVGITFLKRGRIVLAPIRTGLGLRVGANLGYMKFTPRPSLNPF